MKDRQLTIDLGEGSFCHGCLLRGACGEMQTPRACQPIYGEPRYGGLNVLHPARHDLADYFADVRGPSFDNVCAQSTLLPDLPLTIPRLRARRELRGHLRRSFYAVGSDEAIIGRKFVLAADDLRDIVDIWGNQGLALMLFGADLEMEELWRRRKSLIPQIAAAGYDFVAPPSFSARINHPPAEFIFNAKRSLIFFEMLQVNGVPSAPRLAWLSEHDVRRAAEWCNRQEAVRLVVLDLAIKQSREWKLQLELLRNFDLLTGCRLDFFIHGPATESRLVEIFSTLGRRLRLTGTRAISRPRESASDIETFAEEEEAAAYRALLMANMTPSHACGRVQVERIQRLPISRLSVEFDQIAA